MNNDHLVRMCNQIGTFFESMTNREQALEDFANHIKNFWAPSMRNQILSQLEQGDATELSPIATEVLTKYRSILQ